MVINGLTIVLLSLAVFRLARLLVFDTIMAPLRSLFHEEKEEKDADGNIETYIVIKGTGVRAFIGELLSLLLVHRRVVRRLFDFMPGVDPASGAVADFTFGDRRPCRHHRNARIKMAARIRRYYQQLSVRIRIK